MRPGRAAVVLELQTRTAPARGICLDAGPKRNLRPRLALLLIWLAIAGSGFGQKPALRVYSVEDGLKYSQVFAVFQDSRGYIWIGTSYGLARYNGNKCINLIALNGLPHDSVHQILEDGAGKIWAMTQLGPACIDPDRISEPSKCFLPVPEALKNLRELRIARDLDTLWFAQYKEAGLYRMRNGRIDSIPMPEFLHTDEIQGIEPAGGTLYLCTKSHVAAYKNGNWSLIPSPAESQGGNINFVHLPGGLHLLTKTGLLKLEKGEFHPDRTWALPDIDAAGIFDLLPYGKSLVALTASDGFHLIGNNGAVGHFTAQNGLPSNDITGGIIDRDGMLWMATENGLVKIFDFSVLSYSAKSGSMGDVYGFAADPSGAVWVCHQGGMTRFIKKQGYFEPERLPLKGLNINAWAALSVPGGCLAATTGGLVFIGKDQIKRFRDIPLGDSRFYDLFMARDDTIWASSLNGLLHFKWDALLLKPMSVEKYTTDNGLSYNETRSITQSEDGTIWIGTDGGGIIGWDGQTFRHFDQRHGLASNICRSILATPDGLWIGTDRGLFSMRDDKITPIDTVNQNIEDLWIVSMDLGSDGSIWMANSYKVFQIQNRRIVRTIDKSFGLVSTTTTAESCLFLDPRGRLWVGMAGGFSVIEPRGKDADPPEPKVIIESVTTDEGNSVSDGQALPHTENSVTFHFASPTYFAEQLTKFRSILQGNDKNWSELQESTVSRYRNLTPGNYEFRVSAVSASGKTSSAFASLKFSIDKPWWQTPYFQIGCLAAIAVLLGLLYRLRTRQLRRRQQELELIVQERTKQLNQAFTDLQAANLELEKIACSDGLTGLYNKRYFAQILDIEWRRAQREGTSVALIMADVDYFKPFNDHYGHLGGDDCLKGIADVLKTVVTRPGDLSARYGGEEFIILLPSTNMEGAAQVAEKLRSKVTELNIPHEHSQVSPCVTISIGVYACIPGRDESPQQAIAAADRMLYQAKSEGRNRVKICTLS